MHLSFVLIICFILSLINAQSPPTPLAVEITYTESFDTLKGGSEGQQFPFESGETISGWYSNDDSYMVSDGSAIEGGIYSFGESGSAQRALGTITSNKRNTVVMGCALTFNVTVAQLNISVEFSQYRYGGGSGSDVLQCFALVQTLDQYQNGGYGGVYPGPKGWIPVMSFISPINISSNVPVGPVSSAVEMISSIVTIDVPAGDVFQFRCVAQHQKDGLAMASFQLDVLKSSGPVPPSPSQSPTPAPSNPTTTPTSPPSIPTGTPTSQPAVSNGTPKWRIVSGVVGAAGGVTLFAGALGGYIMYRKKRMADWEARERLNAQPSFTPWTGQGYQQTI